MLDMAKDEIKTLMLEIGARARAASQPLSIVPTPAKNAALLAMAEAILARKAEILAANALDLDAARPMAWPSPLSTACC